MSFDVDAGRVALLSNWHGAGWLAYLHVIRLDSILMWTCVPSGPLQHILGSSAIGPFDNQGGLGKCCPATKHAPTWLSPGRSMRNTRRCCWRPLVLGSLLGGAVRGVAGCPAAGAQSAQTQHAGQGASEFCSWGKSPHFQTHTAKHSASTCWSTSARTSGTVPLTSCRS